MSLDLIDNLLGKLETAKKAYKDHQEPNICDSANSGFTDVCDLSCTKCPFEKSNVDTAIQELEALKPYHSMLKLVQSNHEPKETETKEP